MRGGAFHNHVLVKPCAQILASQGATVWLEYPAGPGRTGGYVDVFAELGRVRLVVEAEQTTRRIENDLAKAGRLRAGLLLMVFPTASTAKRAARLVAARITDAEQNPPTVWMLHLGAALCRLVTIRSWIDQLPSRPVTASIQSSPARGGHIPGKRV